MTDTILVVGGAGYVGAHACKELARAGLVPVVFDNLSTGHRDFVRWGPLVEGDVRDPDAVARALDRHGAAAVMHFAACAEVGQSLAEPAMYYENNVGGALSLLKAMRAVGCAEIVFSSSCAVYGEPAHVPIDESHPTAPVSPYGRSKRMVEEILADYGAAYGVRSIVLRYFNACGADPDAEIGERHRPETHLIPRAFLALQGRNPDFAIFGDDYATPDGTAIRDYVHVTDLARAHVSAQRLLTGGHAGGVFNLGTGNGHSVRQVVECIEAVTGRLVPREQRPRRPGDPGVLVANAARARAVLDFAPVVSDLESIVRTAWRWQQRDSR
jgi:UDP-glucose-4-epimerase GalE